MMLNSIDSYRLYFKALAEAHSLINSFEFGGSERILNRTRSDVTYPVLWLEVPEFSSDSESEGEVTLSGAFVILDNSEMEWDAENQAIENTYQIAQQIFRKMIDDVDKEEFEISGDFKCDFVDTFSADNDFGWRVDFNLKVSRGCFISDNGIWKDPDAALLSDDFDSALTDDFGNFITQD